MESRGFRIDKGLTRGFTEPFAVNLVYNPDKTYRVEYKEFGDSDWETLPVKARDRDEAILEVSRLLGCSPKIVYYPRT